MTMYLSNPGLAPTGFEPAEFIDVAPMSPPAAHLRGETACENQAPQTSATLTPYFDGRSQHPSTESIAYLPVRVTKDPRPNGSITVFLLNGTALNLSRCDLLRFEPGSEPRLPTEPCSQDGQVRDGGHARQPR
jgi:hypothetical protein